MDSNVDRIGASSIRAQASLAASKQCCRCSAIKTLDQFYPKGQGRFSARCRACHGVKSRACLVCGRQFEGKSNVKFCSRECRRTHRPRTFLICTHCGTRFGPVDHLSRKFCSQDCKIAAQRTGRRPPRRATPEARRAQSLVAYYVRSGKINRPSTCSQCGAVARIEAAHEDYARPHSIRWLCRSCHVK